VNDTGQPLSEPTTQQAKSPPNLALGCGLLMALIFIGTYIFSELNPGAFAPAPDLEKVYSQGYLFGQGEAMVSLRKGNMSKYPFDRGSIQSFADQKSRQLSPPISNEEARRRWVAGFVAGYADKYDNYWSTGNL